MYFHCSWRYFKNLRRFRIKDRAGHFLTKLLCELWNNLFCLRSNKLSLTLDSDNPNFPRISFNPSCNYSFHSESVTLVTGEQSRVDFVLSQHSETVDEITAKIDLTTTDSLGIEISNSTATIFSVSSESLLSIDRQIKY